MSLLTINKLTESVGAEVVGVDPDRLAADDLLGEAVLEALEDNGVLVFPGLDLDPAGAGGVLPAAGRGRPLLRRAPPGRRHLPGHPRQVEERLGGLPARHVRLAHRRLHPDRGHVSPDGHRAVRRAGRRPRRGDRVRELLCGLRRVERRRRRSGTGRCGSCTRSRPPSAGSPRTPRRRCWRSGGPGARTSIRWCGRTAAVASPWCSARRPTTSSAWIATRAGRCWRSCSTGPPCPTRCTATHWSVGDTVIWDNRGVLHRAAPYDPELAAGDAAHDRAG